MIIQKMSDGSFRQKQEDKEFYNWPRVIARLKDPEGKTYNQELNFPTSPYNSEGSAKEATKKQILSWIKESGNRKHGKPMNLVSFKKL